MSWLLFKTTVLKIWSWLREHWQIPFLLVWTVLVYILTRRNTDAMMEVIEAKRDSYRKQLEILKSTHNNEILKRNNLSEKYVETLEEIEIKFKEKEEELTEIQKEEIKEVVIKSKGNPEEIRRRIEKEFGFRYVK